MPSCYAWYPVKHALHVVYSLFLRLVPPSFSRSAPLSQLPSGSLALCLPTCVHCMEDKQTES